MELKKKKEIYRQSLHIIIGTLVILFALISRDLTLIILFLLFLISILISLISLKTKIPCLSHVFNIMEREEDIKKFPGKGFIFFLAGCLLTLKFFSKNIALAAITVLTFGDSISTLAGFLGKKYNKSPFSKFKTPLGTIVSIVVSFLIAMFFVEPFYALVAACSGMFVEALAIKLGETEADDNLLVPLAAATACYLLTLILK